MEQSKPEVSTQSVINEHALTHYPYKSWCETCVMHNARQDAHVVQKHDKKQHSVVSFDFGCASRVEGDKLTVLYLHDSYKADGCNSYTSEGWTMLQLHSD